MNAIKYIQTTSALMSCIILTVMLLSTACVREYPEEGKEVDPTEIQLTFDLNTEYCSSHLGLGCLQPCLFHHRAVRRPGRSRACISL